MEEKCLIFSIILVWIALHAIVSVRYEKLKYISPNKLHKEMNYSKIKSWIIFFVILIFTPFLVPYKFLCLVVKKIYEKIKRIEKLKEFSTEDEKFIKELMLEMEEREGKRKKMNNEKCASCGAIIPEGRQVCPNCAIRENKMKDKEKQPTFIDIGKQGFDELTEFTNRVIDKHSQIEEMAKVMCGNDCEECAKESAEFYKQTLEEARNNKCLLKNCAKTLYEQGYRKLPKDGVVLKRNEAIGSPSYVRGYQDGGKETAEKILNELYCTPKEQVENKIKDLARFIGVEIKE